MIPARTARRIPVLIAVCLLTLPAPAQYSGGSGTAEDPYQIATAADLIALGETPDDYDKHFILTADIDLDPNLPGGKVFDRAVIGRGWDAPFTGVFDGNGFTISHLTISGQDYVGLFGLAYGAMLSSLGLEAVDVCGTGEYVGGLVGNNYEGDITESYSTGKVLGDEDVGGLAGQNSGHIAASYSASAVTGRRCVGGLVGNCSGSIVSSYSTGEVVGDEDTGGLVGQNRGIIASCYSTGAITGGKCAGGLVGTNYGSIAMGYSAGAVMGDEDVGGLVGQDQPYFDRHGIVRTGFWDMGTSGQSTSAGGTGLTTADMQNIDTYLDAGWDLADEVLKGTCDFWHMSAGDYPRLCYNVDNHPVMPEGLGTAEQPYLVRDSRDLGTVWSKPRAHYRLEASLELSGLTWSMAVIPWFGGTFDGNDRVLSGLHIRGGQDLGLFGYLDSDVRIADLGLEGLDITGTGDNIGGLAGRSWGDITNCHTGGAITGNCQTGGLVGCNGGTVTGCYGTGTVSGDDGVGGLIGYNEGDVTRCWNTGAIAGNSSVGGLVGANDLGGDVHSCYSAGAVSQNSSSSFYGGVGGLVGWNLWVVRHSYSTGNVTGTHGYVGGLVGANGMDTLHDMDLPEIHHCYSTGRVSSREGDTGGGLVGLDGLGSIITASFWDMETSGESTSSAGTGLTTAEMQDPNTFVAVGWDFVGENDGPHDRWAMPEGGGYPLLWWQLPPGYGLPTFSGGTGEPNNPYIISTAQELRSIGDNPRLMETHFRLAVDLDLTDTRFYPIGGPEYPYDGAFDGNGHTISHLSLTGEDYVGLFGSLGDGALVESLGVLDVNVVASGEYIGGLVGCNGGDVIACHSTGMVAGSECVGGLVGKSGIYDASVGTMGFIGECDSTATVSGQANVGGLVGYNLHSIRQSQARGSVVGSNVKNWGGFGGLVGTNSGDMTDCSTASAVTSVHHVGGLSGINHGQVTRCFSAGTVTGNFYVGGLVGWNWRRITESFSTSEVDGSNSVGGLVGNNEDGEVKQCYASGVVSGSYRFVGGLVGNNRGNGEIVQCYGNAVVAGPEDVGGLLGNGHPYSYVTHSFWDIQASGQPTSDGGTGKTTAEMQTASTFIEAGWDFVGETDNGTEDIWWILEGQDYPRLWWEFRN